jgi:nitrogen regulatory protein PII
MHTQHLRQKVSRIERDSGLDGDDLPKLTLAIVLSDDRTIERVNDNVVRIEETGELRQG